jgi:hypothetical protein
MLRFSAGPARFSLPMIADPQRMMLLSSLTSPHVAGLLAEQTSPSGSRGAATRYFTSTLAAISIPAMQKVHILCWKRLASREQRRTTKPPIIPFPAEPV